MVKYSTATIVDFIYIKKGFIIALFLYCFFTPNYILAKNSKIMDYVQIQQNMGPRIPGTKSHKQFINYILKNYKNSKIDSSLVDVKETILLDKERRWKAYNIIINRGSNLNKKKIFISAHYDSRIYSDKDKNISKRAWPMPSANDGASGIAIILYLIDHLDFSMIPFSVDFILFDFEDQGSYSNEQSFCLGSQNYAKHNNINYIFGINVDMVGDKDLQIYYEQNSLNSALELNQQLFSIGQTVEKDVFIKTPKYNIYDDHIPMINSGIPVVELIDIEYPYWHTTEDTQDKLSEKSLKIVEETIEKFLYNF